MRRLTLIPLALLTMGNTELPPAVKTMLDAAMASGSEAEVTTVAKYAALASPEHAEAIRLAATNWRDARSAQQTRVIREADFFELMKGRAELGGYYTTGNTDNIGLAAAVDLTREGLQWRHKLKLAADYQKSSGITSRERFLAAYEPNYKIDDRFYMYGAAQFESDRFLGYTERYSLSAGAGYGVIRERTMTLDIELGPAYRFSEFTDFTSTRELGARGSLDFDWRLSPKITFSQDAAAYIQNMNSTVTTKTAIAARLFGPLSAQLSYAVSYESDPPVGRVNTDTTSRASLVYAF